MFCMLKKEKIYPAYVSKHNSNLKKEVTLLMISNGKKRETNSDYGITIVGIIKIPLNITIIKRNNV